MSGANRSWVEWITKNKPSIRLRGSEDGFVSVQLSILVFVGNGDSAFEAHIAQTTEAISWTTNLSNDLRTTAEHSLVKKSDISKHEQKSNRMKKITANLMVKNVSRTAKFYCDVGSG